MKNLKDQIRLLAKQEGISINKMVIKLIELGLILYFKGGMIKDENVLPHHIVVISLTNNGLKKLIKCFK